MFYSDLWATISTIIYTYTRSGLQDLIRHHIPGIYIKIEASGVWVVQVLEIRNNVPNKIKFTSSHWCSHCSVVNSCWQRVKVAVLKKLQLMLCSGHWVSNQQTRSPIYGGPTYSTSYRYWWLNLNILQCWTLVHSILFIHFDWFFWFLYFRCMKSHFKIPPRDFWLVGSPKCQC